MKKKYKLFSILCAAALLCSCVDREKNVVTEAESDPDTSESSSQEETSLSEATTAGSEEETSLPEATTAGSEYENGISDLPRMDGSTSAAPLEIGLKSGLLGISYEQAKELVSHTTTHDSFKRLINGEVDLIFSVPISEEQQKMADEAGVTLFMEPVAKEGFVFAVNAENPVDSLTSEQLRRIYSGEITNWSEVGGNDELILPYQRNTDSGSQNYMTVFMGDTPMLPPKTELVEGMMMSLMDAIAVYDNSAGAIGYSVYSYAAQMYANANKVKFIAVDGVAPSKATMADESYPLLSCTYIIYTDRSPKSAREFTERALSDEGQRCVLDSGYLPVNGMEVPEQYLPYEAKGTGKPKPDDFVPSENYAELFFGGEGYTISDKYYEITFLTDGELQQRINADIRTAMDNLRQYYDPKYDDKNGIDGIILDMDCRNGYLSLVLGYRNNDVETDPMFVSTSIFYHAETLNYDLIEGKRIEHFSELFYEGEDFMSDVNKSIDNWISQKLTAYSELEQKSDFSGILGEPRLFTINSVGLEPQNMYFTCAPFLNYSDNNRRCIVSQYRDMSEVIAKKYTEGISDIYYREWECYYAVEDGDVYIRIAGSPYHTEEEIVEEDELWYELQKRTWDAIRRSYPEWTSDIGVDIGIDKNEKYFSVRLRSPGAGDLPGACFDADTLELITMEMLIGENWRDYVPDEYKELELIPNVWFENGENEDIFFNLVGIAGWPKLQVPKEVINKKYLR
ncbi:MAG: substrate-binding domain-containing protein [Bacteroides sp.]|nr:substrate-binding domain-containing protein [Bacteroides sp.]